MIRFFKHDFYPLLFLQLFQEINLKIGLQLQPEYLDQVFLGNISGCFFSSAILFSRNSSAREEKN